MKREKAEALVGKDLVLIYPLVKYEHQYFIEDQFPIEEKALKLEIETKRQEAQAKAEADGQKKVDFNLKRDCYEENVKSFVFDLDVKRRNAKGEILTNPAPKAEEVADFEFRNQVYERCFKKL